MNPHLIPNFTQVPNLLLDVWMPVLSGAEVKVVLLVARKTYGWRKEIDCISLSQLCEGTGMARSTVVAACATLEEKGVLTCIHSDLPKGVRGSANAYRLNLDADLSADTGSTKIEPPRKSEGYENPTRGSTKIEPGVVRKSNPQKKGLNKDLNKEREREGNNAYVNELGDVIPLPDSPSSMGMVKRENLKAQQALFAAFTRVRFGEDAEPSLYEFHEALPALSRAVNAKITPEQMESATAAAMERHEPKRTYLESVLRHMTALLSPESSSKAGSSSQQFGNAPDVPLYREHKRRQPAAIESEVRQ